MSDLTDYVAGRLATVGVRAVFGVPGGGGNLDLIDSAGRAGLPFVLTATETGAVLAAMAQAEVTGRPGACLATLGPGAASLANGLACAFLDRAPVLAFTDAHPTSAAGAFTHQQLDHQALFAPITKWSGRLTAGTAVETIDDAIDAVLTDPPGPVHVDCPGDAILSGGVAAGRSSGSAAPAPADDRGAGRLAYEADPLAREALGALVAKARKPVAIIGLGARRTDDAAAIRSLCNRRGVPAMVTYKAKGVVPDDHAWYAGVFTNAEIERPLITESDLILGIGLDPVELLPRSWTYVQPVAYVGRWPVSAGQVPFAVQVVGDVAGEVRPIESVLSRTDWEPGAVARDRERQHRLVDIPGAGLTAQRAVALAAARLASACRVTVDAGAHMFPATMLWPVSEPNRMLISNGLSTMGFALPAAIGAALADPIRPVVALTGDGGLLICAGELLTAVRERLRIITVVFNDSSLSLIETKQQGRKLPPAGVALGRVDWRAVAGGFGLPAFAAGDAAALERALDEAAGCAGPSLIDVTIDRSTYAQVVAAVRTARP